MSKAIFLLSVVLASLAAVSAQGVCGTTQEGTGGAFTSPNYPSNYPNNLGCQLFIIASNGGHVVIEFHDFATGATDKVTIHDGLAETSPVMAELAGTYGPLIFETSGNSAFINFRTDAAGSNRGFNATWYEYFGPPITTPTTPAPPTTPGPTNCGYTVTGVSGTFQSNNYPDNYQANSRCIWQITSQNSLRLTFHIVDMDLEPGYDTLVIHDGPSALSPVLYEGSGVAQDLFVLTSQSDAYVIFTSDSSIQRGGFKVNWQEVAATTTQTPGK